jgi:hypothetical protein
MDKRDYLPAGVVHVADCDDAPAGLLTIPAKSLRGSHDRPHSCVTTAAVAANRDVVVERLDVEPHGYARSTIWPEDAARPLCRICRGTHPGEATL